MFSQIFVLENPDLFKDYQKNSGSGILAEAKLPSAKTHFLLFSNPDYIQLFNQIVSLEERLDGLTRREGTGYGSAERGQIELEGSKNTRINVILLLKSHFSKFYREILHLSTSIATKTCDISLQLIATHLNENAHVELLEFNPQYQGVWQTSPINSSTITGLGYFDAISEKIKATGVKNASIKFVPLSTNWIASDIFCLNGDYELFPSLSPSANDEKTEQYVDFAAKLSSFLDTAYIKETVFSVGPLSKQIAQSLVSLSQNSHRRSSTDMEAALVIVDRTLDLAVPSMYSENMLDLIYDYCPRAEPHSAECLLDVSTIGLNQMQESLHPDSKILLDYSVQGPVKQLLDSLVSTQNERQALEHLKSIMIDFILEFIVPCPDPSELHGPATADHIKKLTDYLNGQPSLMLQQEETIAYLSALATSKYHNLSARQELLSAEKVIVALFAQTGETSHIFYQLYDMLSKIAKEKQAGVTPVLATRDILLLTLHMYSMIGDSALIEPQHETYLQKGFVQAMMASNPKANSRAVTAWVGRVFGQLSLVSSLRSRLQTPSLRNLVDFDSVYPFTPFLVKLSLFLLQPPQIGTNPDNPDVISHTYKNASLRTVLTGFSRLIGSTSSHPSSFSTIILFVIGGITFQEISQLKALYKEKGVRLVIGSNTICNRDSLMLHIFKSK